MVKVNVGVSSCLLGNQVRYDGQHQLNPYLRDGLGPHVTFVPVCPEVECGLPVPREAMHLEGDPANPRLVTIRTGCDLTEQMTSYVARRLDELASEDLDGFVFKKNSPSSGLERVKVFNVSGIPSRTGRGMFAGAFIARFPEVAVIEDGMLNDRFLRERFLNRIFSSARLREACASGCSSAILSEFQARHKLMLMSHAPGRYQELGQLVEDGDCNAYRHKLNELLTLMPTVRKHINVMQHMLGYFKKELQPWEKAELLEALEQYRQNNIQISVPLTLLRHYARKYEKSYLLNQTYWDILSQLYA